MSQGAGQRKRVGRWRVERSEIGQVQGRAMKVVRVITGIMESGEEEEEEAGM